jgi:hypothetical protein
MREIKFRVWDKKNMKMQYSSIVWGIPGLKCPALTGIDDNEDIDTLSDLMQYTGLKDKNGVEIYEKDIVKKYVKDGQVYAPPFAVVYDNESCNFSINGKKYHYYEVVGNIYEDKI